MADSIQTAACAEHVASLDNQLSQRFIALDPAGYFLIRIDHDAHELIVEHYRNDVDDRGRATDPDTGEVLSCRGGAPRSADAVLRAPTAKAMGIQLTEGDAPHPLTRLDHALYLGRELQKAEQAMLAGQSYVQD